MFLGVVWYLVYHHKQPQSVTFAYYLRFMLYEMGATKHKSYCAFVNLEPFYQHFCQHYTYLQTKGKSNYFHYLKTWILNPLEEFSLWQDWEKNWVKVTTLLSKSWLLDLPLISYFCKYLLIEKDSKEISKIFFPSKNRNTYLQAI